MLEKERKAGHKAYVELVQLYAAARGIELPS
jgi:hypothetical protein